MRYIFLPIIIGAALGLSHQEADAANIDTPEISASEASLTARGVLVPKQTADIAAAMSGRLTKAPYKAGAYINAGAEIARFDCARQEAELNVRQKAHETASLKYENQNELLSMGAAGELDVNIARSERDQLAAEISAIQVALKDCVVIAPFSGYVATRHVNAFETPQAGQPLYSLIRAGTPELSIIVPSDWTKWLKAGTSFQFRVDETGKEFTAKVIRLSAAVDPVSQTLEITAQPTGKTGSKPGMSGVAVFTPPKS